MKEKIKATPLEISLESLNKSIDVLDSNIRKDISFKRSFLLSIVRGIGYTLGATIVAGILIVVLTYILSYTQYIPFLRDYLSPNFINKILGTESGS